MRAPFPALPIALPLALAVLAAAAGSVRAEQVSVMLDHSARLSVRGAANVVIGNPGIADVTVVDSRTVFVSGRNYGSTDIVIMDRDGRTLYSGDVTVVRPLSSVAVYHGVDRADFSCSGSCTKEEHPISGAASQPANPVTALMQATSAPTPFGPGH